MQKKPAPHQQLTAENQSLHSRLEKAEATLSEILSGEADALFVTGVGGAQLFTLKGADQSYRTLIENMSEGALTLTPEGLVLYANRRFAGMLRTPLEKVIGSEIHNWFAPESRQALQALLQKDALENHREELALAAADGILVPVYLSVSHLHLDGMPDSICMVATDLTEQKRNEAILAAEKLSNAILEQAADAIVICDETGRIMRASKQAQALYGTSPLGQLFEQAFPLSQPDGTAFSAVGAIDTNRQLPAEARLERNGQGFDLLVSVGHLKGARNELLGSVVTLTDITERKRSNDLMQESEARYRALFDESADGILIADIETKTFQDANPTLCRMLGYNTDELRTMGVLDLHPKDAMQSVVAEFEALARGDKTHTIDIPCLRKDGSVVYADISATLIDVDGRPCNVGFFRDITERRQAEEARKHREAELQESQRIARIGSWEWTIATGVVTWSDGMNHVLARNSGSPSPTFETLPQFYTPEGWQRLGVVIARAIETGASYDLELEMIRADGATCWTITRGETIRGADGTVVKLRGTVLDITEQKRDEIRIKRLNRVYAVLSGINTLIVRTQNRQELFDEACRITVEQGKFRLAWIGLLDANAVDVIPAARAGVDEGYLDNIRLTARENVPDSCALVARVLREKTPVICNDIDTDPRMARWREEALRRGYRSVVVFPLQFADKVSGVFLLYASEKDFFDTEEMKLLTELAGDVSFAIDHIEKQERLNYLAYYDVLTGLANRSLFLERVGQYIRSTISGGNRLAIGLIDLERFKNINDSLGRSAGDALLRQVAEWLTRNAGDVNLLARIDADHFALVMPEVRQDGDLARLVEKTMAAFLQHPFHLNDAVFRISAKIGIALFPDDGFNADTLLRNAEAALKKAKASGDRYLFYTQKMTAAVSGQLTLENQLRQAIDNEEFVLHYQPKVNLVSGKVTSAEALIRWNDPRTGLVPPGQFIPILEETGLIYEVGRWALRQAIADYLRWRSAGLPAVRIAVNVSPMQLRNINFIDEIRQVITLDSHAAAGLELEITESLIMADVKHSITSLESIRAMGITIAIDDFGTGFSSLSYLAKLPVDTLKIDRSFVTEMDAPEGLALVSTIILVAHALKLKVVAEGVETEKQSRQLLSLNCDEMQGFLFSKPVPAEIFEARFLAPLTLKI